MLSMNETEQSATIGQKIFAASAYAIASTLMMVINKAVFSSFGFQSFLFVALTQYATSLIVLLGQRRLKMVSFPSPWLHWRQTFFDIFPLPLLFFANTISGLGATQRLNMPLFVLLRRFSIVMTMGLEAVMLRREFSSMVKSSVGLMVLGAVIAALNDMTIQLFGVVMILLNDTFTALQGVMLRKKLDDKAKLGSHGLMFYSNLYSAPLVVAAIFVSDSEIQKLRSFDKWHDPFFLVCLSGSAVMGFVLNYAYFMCTKYNSPLTTTVIGAGKNILTSYLGMLFKDYHYTLLNFVGLNISVVGSMMYNWSEWLKMRDADRVRRAQAKAGQLSREEEHGKALAEVTVPSVGS
jgi:hypothetical protein